jgi:hypothetical protein
MQPTIWSEDDHSGGEGWGSRLQTFWGLNLFGQSAAFQAITFDGDSKQDWRNLNAEYLACRLITNSNFVGCIQIGGSFALEETAAVDAPPARLPSFDAPHAARDFRDIAAWRAMAMTHLIEDVTADDGWRTVRWRTV